MTSFKEYLDHAWKVNGTEAKAVADELKTKFNLMEDDNDVMSMAGLIVHICGEQVGNWEQGIDLLKKLKNNAPVKDKEQMKRLAAILNLGNNPNISIEEFSPSDQVRIYSATSQALVNLGGLKNAEKLFSKAVELSSKVSNDDVAQTELVAAGNTIVKKLPQDVPFTALVTTYLKNHI